ncbi:DUF2334 domain-containing protein [Thermochromatium tepidum]|uniref:DUF2334 domain-containing protein n=1 Tax=Thermochromatium tepidum ATCC 43061 TaxID=316276 RepID=A0A6I6E3Q5_THETI|nr:polysaccharide deacetylase family protein [Thermochromatium tepidum]QGU32392.1 DUF2334 domain-containing protein [Thermochromatium tepidum ATCC 43061]
MDVPAAIRTLVSVHDVMPATLTRVQPLVEWLEAAGVYPITLLVVPGLDWSEAQLAVLREYAARGHQLAGHGWIHRVERYGGIRHRLHACFVSRNVAEHLTLDTSGRLALMRRCHDWFGAHGLGAPRLYVPPAWALGRVTRAALVELPFEYCEVFGGVIATRTGRFHPLPLLGYEADAAWRIPIIRLWNRYNRARAQARGWLRLGVHPYDPELALAADLHADLRRFRHYADYDALDAEDEAIRDGDS